MDASSIPKRRFQFSIRGLLLTTLVIAVGCSVGCLKNAKWEDGLLAFAATWVVAGLVQQIADLYRAMGQATGLSPDQRSGWWFAMLARGALAMLLVAHFLVIELLATNRLALANPEDESSYLGISGHETLRNAILAMTFLLIFAGLEPNGRPRRRPWTPAVDLLTTVAVLVLVVLLLRDRFLVFGLVHIACAGIAMGMLHGAAASAWIYSDARAWSFFSRALLASGFLVLDLVCLRQVISCWIRKGWLRPIAVATLGISLALTAIFPAWLASDGLKSVSPCFAEVFTIAPINRWFFGMVLAVVFVTAAARRMIPLRQAVPCDTSGSWRRRPAAYFHEHRWLALFVAGTVLVVGIGGWLEMARGFGLFMVRVTAWDAPGLLLTDVRYQLWLLVFCLCAALRDLRLCKAIGSMLCGPARVAASVVFRCLDGLAGYGCHGGADPRRAWIWFVPELVASALTRFIDLPAASVRQIGSGIA